jgi:WD40 repeat protein
MPFVVRDAETGVEQSRFGSVEHLSAFGASVHPDKKRLLWQMREAVDLWDADDGRHLARLPRPGRASLTGLCCHPSGRFFATTGRDGCVRFWDADSLRQVRAFKWDIGKLYSLAFSADGALAAAGGEKGQVVVWDVDV